MLLTELRMMGYKLVVTQFTQTMKRHVHVLYMQVHVLYMHVHVSVHTGIMLYISAKSICEYNRGYYDIVNTSILY